MGYRSAVMADTPLAYWRLGEASGTTAADETGNFPGTYDRDIILGQPSLLPGDAGTSVEFEGTNSELKLNTPSTSPTLAGWTFEFWIITEHQAVNVPGLMGELTFERAHIVRQVHQTSTWDLQLRAWDSDTGTEGRHRDVSGLPYNEVMHIVVTYEDAQTLSPVCRVYRDGTQIASFNDYGSALRSPYQEFAMGMRDGTIRIFKGRMDEVAFYDHALSAARVEAHYDAGLSSQVATPTGFTFTKTENVAEVTGAWTAVTDAATYDYEVEEWNGSAWQAFAVSAVTDPTTSFTLGSADGVTFSTLYRARVRAVPAP